MKEQTITENHKLKGILQEIKGTCIYYREQMGIRKGSVTDFLAGEILNSIDKMEV